MPRAWIFKPAIVLFCLFHITAVAVYSVSADWKITPLTYIREKTLPWIRPYLLITSQWQQWNLFSPDPLRRVSRYRIVWESQGIAQEGPWFDDVLSYHRKANLTKTLRRLEEQSKNSPIQLQFLAIACRERDLSPKTAIRLERRYSILPNPETPLSPAQWKALVPDWKTDTMAERSCPARS